MSQPIRRTKPAQDPSSAPNAATAADATGAADARRTGEAAEIIRALRNSTNAEQVAAFGVVLRMALERGADDARDAQIRLFPVSAEPDGRPGAQYRSHGARTRRAA
jgi:hypothetical protein